MSKRRADKDLNHDNWNVEDDSPQEDWNVPFKRASEEELAKRRIKTARRRGAESLPNSATSIFKNFTGFGNLNTAQSGKLPFYDFTAKKDSSKFEATSFKLPTTSSAALSTTPSFSFGSSVNTTSTTNKPKVNGVDGSPKGSTDSDIQIKQTNNKVYLASLKTLNEGVLKWIQKHLDANVYINLLPVFDDYKKHFDALDKKYQPSLSKSSSDLKSPEAASNVSKAANGDASPEKLNKLNQSLEGPKSNNEYASESSTSVKSKSLFLSGSLTEPKSNESTVSAFGGSITKSPETFSFGAKTTAASTAFAFSSVSNASSTSSFGSGKLTFGAPETNNTTTSAGFSFGTTPAFSFGMTTQPPSTSSSSSTKENDEDAPPKEEIVEVKEKDAIYEKKCKLFYKKDSNFADKGVGTLFLKPVPDSNKTQLIVRAATNLGNVLLNILLNPSMPTQRMGKNNVLIVCIPNPPIDPKGDNTTPVSMLIRVKTGEDADELLKKIDELKAPQ